MGTPSDMVAVPSAPTDPQLGPEFGTRREPPAAKPAGPPAQASDYAQAGIGPDPDAPVGALTSQQQQPSAAAADPDAPVGSLRQTYANVQEARSGFAANTLKAFGRGFFGVAQQMSGEKPEEIAAFQKKWGLTAPPPKPFDQDDPHPVTSEIESALEGRAGEVIGGLMFPVGGPAAQAGAAATEAVPTLGMRTGKEWLQKVEASLAKLPGGSAIMKAVRDLNQKYADQTRDIIDRMTGGADVSATSAGKAIEEQIRVRKLAMAGEGEQLYGEVDRLMPPDTPVHMRNTITTLQELTNPKAGAEHLSGEMTNPTFLRWRQAIEKDVQEHGYLPYGAVKQIRTEVGQELDEGVFSDLPNAQLERIYESMSADMMNSAGNRSEEALAAVNRANSRWKAIKEEQAVLQSVMKKYGGPENVFRSLMQTGQQNKWGGGATVIKQVLAAVDEPTRTLLAASALHRMGRATAGMQERLEGDTFSAATFLTNWSNLSDEAKQALFGKLPGNYSQEVTRLARNVEALKAYGKLIPNPSGTAHAWWSAAELNGFIVSLVTGHVTAAAGIAAGYATTKIAATALTQPATVRWLADQTAQMLVQASKGAIAVGAQPAPPEEPQPDFSDLTR